MSCLFRYLFVLRNALLNLTIYYAIFNKDFVDKVTLDPTIKLKSKNNSFEEV